MNPIQKRASQSEAIARASIKQLTNDRLAATWTATNTTPHSRALVITRGWLLDELERRMNALDAKEATSPTYLGQYLDRFDRWMVADSSEIPVNPLTFLA